MEGRFSRLLVRISDQWLAELAKANKVRESSTPFYVKKQTYSASMTAKKRYAVTKTFVDDTTGAVANWFVQIEDAERTEYIVETT